MWKGKENLEWGSQPRGLENHQIINIEEELSQISF